MSKYMFTAQWCGACQAVKQTMDVEALDVKIIDVESLEGKTLATEFSVMSLPTFINGNNRLIGAQPKDTLEAFFNEKV